MCDAVNSQLGFLARDAIYDTIKPYSLRFTPPDSSPRHNLKISMVPVRILDARPLNPTLEKHGFTLTRIPTSLVCSDFSDHTKIESIYATELQTHLKRIFHARHVRVVDYAVRRRHAEFPLSTGQEYSSQQPATLVHLDFAQNEAIKMLRTFYGARAEEILKHRWQVVNVWRPLRGPLFDWPLAVCDARTFNQERDGEVSDAVYPEWAYENVLVHHNPNHQWYYFSAMQETETMVFKCIDSDGGATGQSIESRAFIFWGPVDEDFPEEVGSVYGKRI
ncbi:hypothetical protein F5Y12DRAFT_796024 [Xylaria sp. FL1777]|nr:hypothetical protein F5Y12DRAFT_796024 [Xylaria sp. FL1777]